LKRIRSVRPLALVHKEVAERRLEILHQVGMADEVHGVVVRRIGAQLTEADGAAAARLAREVTRLAPLERFLQYADAFRRASRAKDYPAQPHEARPNAIVVPIEDGRNIGVRDLTHHNDATQVLSATTRPKSLVPIWFVGYHHANQEARRGAVQLKKPEASWVREPAAPSGAARVRIPHYLPALGIDRS